MSGRMLPRVKDAGPPRPCLCGRPFTTRSGKANHARHCPDVWARNAAQLADAFAVMERARARTAAARAAGEPIPSRRRARGRTVPPPPDPGSDPDPTKET